ncbi:MAG: hypothetical protein KDD60_03680, partial [Bdellovibrionales bacterium]|nr:hypothetical protein [Bdellovibrionales bacterium]
MLGKFVAAWLFLGLSLLLTFPIVLTVSYLGDPDLGVIVAAYIGSFLMAGAYLSVGCCVSAFTANQVISFVVSTAICLLMILLGFDPVIRMLTNVFPASFADQLMNLSFIYHFEAIQRGVVNLADVVYFVSVILFSLFVGVIILDRKKAD